MPPVLLTVTVVAVGRGELFSEAVTVTVVAAALSPTAAGFSDSVTAVGAGVVVGDGQRRRVRRQARRAAGENDRLVALVQTVSGRVEGQLSPSRWSAHEGIVTVKALIAV